MLYQGGNLGQAEATEIRCLIESTDAQEFSSAESRRFFDQAMELLNKLRPAEPAGSHLREISEFLILRTT
jgi:geranylgeranyl pyrophosphate synthase